MDRKYTAGGCLVKTENWEYKYDKEGNLIRKKDKHGATWRYEWNEAGMLESVKRPDAAEVTFKYDALGRRIEKRFGKRTTVWFWDGNVPLHEKTETRTPDYSEEKGYFDDVRTEPVVTWVFEEGTFVPAAKITEKQQYSIVTNYLGTPEAMYGEDGEEVWTCELNSYGKVRNWQGKVKTDCPFRYQGQYEDAETGLYYNRFRYYSPEEGMYISQDPMRLSGGISFYGYAHNPNEWVDEFGLKACPPKIKALQEGENGTVVKAKSKKEADELLKASFPNAKKVRGIGSQDAKGVRKKHKMDEFKKKDGQTRYHKDYPIDKKTGRVYGHDDPKGTGHGKNPHINIKRSDGTMVRIDIENGD